jgi:hypothetical protein
MPSNPLNGEHGDEACRSLVRERLGARSTPALPGAVTHKSRVVLLAAR